MNCPVCGTIVEIVSSDEGTHYYEPTYDKIKNAEIRSLRARLSIAEQVVEAAKGFREAVRNGQQDDIGWAADKFDTALRALNAGKEEG